VESFDTGLPKAMPVATWSQAANSSQPMLAHVSGTHIRMWNISWEALERRRGEAEPNVVDEAFCELHSDRTASTPTPVNQIDEATSSNGEVTSGIRGDYTSWKHSDPFACIQITKPRGLGHGSDWFVQRL
jgi:hypothetical protein